MRKFIFMAIAPLVLVTALSGPAAAINAKEALAGVGSGDDSVTHDGGGVSICKGGTFPNCQGGKAFYCPPGGKPCEKTQQARKPKTAVTGVVPGGAYTVRSIPTEPMIPGNPIKPELKRLKPATGPGGAYTVRSLPGEPMKPELKRPKPATGSSGVSKVTQPGLLEGSGGFSGQGPSGTGSPVGSGSVRGSSSGGGTIR
jgi:hypothetical protein